ncbi:iron (metal) dependent repressor, DtxR family [Butyrivibrio fibrisolvens]|uniref:Iron (Metal) dependent repressor, DtxR family n=1 Tax=Butyrivibrio fibrisolvens TaxID=831 RepID=A0A1H9LBE6_BUTFI|nr:metal-dependent transcriptional regulator [Butyrivibrio fibrisolvens]SER08549.1 iron (metal) dependent repressor, DtxR family [Butyrivibrio fibrisolvens]
MHESGEDYLETIYVLRKRNGSVRSVDVANELNFSRPSVSRAVGILKEDGYITVEEDGELVLTKLGLEKAKSVYDRHTNLTKFLMLTAGVDEQTAETDACRIEHIISVSTFAGIKKYLKENSK